MANLDDFPAALAAENEPCILKCILEPQYPISVYTGPPLSMSEDEHRRYVRWRYTTRNGSPELIWLREPTITRIAALARPYVQALCPQMGGIHCSFLARGAFNIAYTVTALMADGRGIRSFVLRIAAPTYPYFKTEAEVATMELGRHSSTVPVPRIYFYSSTWRNCAGFEWILMEKVDGKWAVEVYDGWEWPAKQALARQLARWTLELAEIKADRIGSVFMHRTQACLVFYVGRCVSFEFFVERNLWRDDVARGPFRDIKSYFTAILAFQKLKMVQLEQEARIRESRPREMDAQAHRDDNNGSEARPNNPQPPLTLLEEIIQIQADSHDAEDYNWRAYSASYLHRILTLLSHHERIMESACTSLQHAPFQLRTILMHPDLAERNLLVNAANQCVAVLDWEYVELLPAVFSPGYPLYMRTAARTAKPILEFYLLRGAGNGFREAVREYENGFLRVLFREEVRRGEPGLAGQFWVGDGDGEMGEWRTWKEVWRYVREANVFKGGNEAWLVRHCVLP